MAWRDERPGVQLLRPLQPATARSGRVRERRDPPVSVQCRERGASGVRRQSLPQDLESGDSTTVVKCAIFALPPSDFQPRQPRQNTEGVVIPFLLPCLLSIAPSLTKYA